MRPGPPTSIIVNYCCTHVVLYAKMLKETETEETIVFLVTFLSSLAFQLRGCSPLATSMVYVVAVSASEYKV